MSLHDLTMIAGPTAVGKSAYAEALAREKNGIIINADALQIYDALPILTAQPDARARAAIPHALYGTLTADVVLHARAWLDLALPVIRAAWTHGAHPIVVGGTGLYLKTLIHGLSPVPDIPAAVRDEVRALHTALGNPAFHAHLAEIDPVMAARLKPGDSHRLMRAYEVMRATGKSLATWHELPGAPPLPEAVWRTILIDGPRESLRIRARARLAAMMECGVLDEVAAFKARIDQGELAPDAPPTRALGYHALAASLDGAMTRDEAFEAAVTETCQYIKRQQTWFRHQHSCG